MQDIGGKNIGEDIPAAEWNQLAQELKAPIVASGQALSAGSVIQLGKAIAAYAAVGHFYTDGGSADTVQLSPIGTLQAPPFYFDGLLARFRPAFAGTGAATLEIASLGAKALVRPDGSVLEADDLATTRDARARYEAANDRFLLEIPRGTAVQRNAVKLRRDNAVGPSSTWLKWGGNSGAPFFSLLYDDAMWWNPSNPFYLTVPVGIRRVHIDAWVSSSLASFTVGGAFQFRRASLEARVLKNDTFFSGQLYGSEIMDTSGFTGVTVDFVMSDDVDVMPGDTFTLETMSVPLLNAQLHNLDAWMSIRAIG